MRKLFIPFLAFIAFYLVSCQKDPLEKLHPDVTTDGSHTDTLLSVEDTIQLTGSATDRDGQVVSYLWSLISGPNLPQILTPSMATTSITSVQSGTYIFQLTATDNDGLTGVAMDTLNVFLKQPTTVVLKNDAATIDEMLIAGNATDNYSDGGSPEIDAYNWTQYGLIDLGKGAFKFNLSAIPATTVLKSAKLTLYSNPSPQNGNHVDANYGAANDMFIERITSPWNNQTTTWQNQPTTDTQDHVVIPQSNQPKEDLIDIDVTSLVQKMLNDTNYGFEIRLRSNDIYNSRLFCGSRFADSSKHPVLKVTY